MELDNRIVLIPKPESDQLLSKYRAFYTKGGKYLFCLKPNDDLQIPGLKSIYVIDYINRMLVDKALSQLERYLEGNQNNLEMYRYDDFWEQALSYAGRVVVPEWCSVLATKIESGVINLWNGKAFFSDYPMSCYYDIAEDCLLLKYSNWQRKAETAPQDFMGFFFLGAERHILAQRQFEAGLIPAPYMAAYFELCRINSFLEDKRTVRAHFEGNKHILCYPRQLQTAAFLIKLKNQQFVNFTYNYRCDEEGNEVELCETDGLPYKLTHYSKELVIDTEAFADLNLLTKDKKERVYGS